MENASKIHILITNDDGFKAPNIRALATALSQVGEVYVFAPETEQSGVSQAFTVRKMLDVRPVPLETDENGILKPWPFEFYSVSGTPDDCAKFAMGHFSRFGMKPECAENARAESANEFFDVCFSGVNIGENSGVSSLYSGTVAGARESALWGVPSVALSLSVGGESLLPKIIEFAKRVVEQRLFLNMAPHTFWNVNFPKGTPETFKGIKATRMALGMFTDHYDCREENFVSKWQLDGMKLWDAQPVDTDDYLLHQGYATVTPHRIDQTDEKSLEEINKMLAGGSL